MAASTGVVGHAGLILTLKQGAATATSYADDVKSVNINSEDRDDSDLTFYEAAQGQVKDFTLDLTAIQSTEAASLWKLFWENPGAEFTVVYGPHGNAVASATKPHFSFTAKATGQPPIGGEARRGKERYEFEYQLEVTSAITLVTS